MVTTNCQIVLETNRGNSQSMKTSLASPLSGILQSCTSWTTLLRGNDTFELFVLSISVHNHFRVGMQTMANLVLTKNPCNMCGMNLGVYMCQVRDRLTTPKRKHIRLHHPSVAFICYDCMQEPFDERHKRWWQEVFHNHVVLADPMIQSRVSQYLWSSIHPNPCLCGRCDPSWLLRGWICWG